MSYDFLNSCWLYVIASISLLVSLPLSLYTLCQHLLFYTSHTLQRYIVRILMFIPIYGVLTFILLCAPSLMEVLEMLRNIWEGLLIHSFLCLMMEYCGGESECGERISRDPAVIRHLWPLSLIKAFSLNEDIPLNVGFVKRCRMGTIQYAIVRLLLTLIILILKLFDFGGLKVFSYFCSLLLNISVYSALYFLGLFYMAIRKHPGLAKANSVSKFFSLKLCFALSFYQNCMIDWFADLPDDIELKLKSSLVIVELIIFAISQRMAYKIEEFSSGSSSTSSLPISMDVESADARSFSAKLKRIREDLHTITSPNGYKTILENGKKALDMSDMFQDTYHNISDKYRQHTLFTGNTEEETTDLSVITEQVGVENFAEFDKVQGTIYKDEPDSELQKLQFI